MIRRFHKYFLFINRGVDTIQKVRGRVLEVETKGDIQLPKGGS